MEPLDDEFHAGLDFQNVTARSVSDFGIPDSFLADNNGRPQANRKIHADDTDEDVDDLPVEETDGTTRYANLVSYPSAVGRASKTETSSDGNGFEFIDKTDLRDVTDEEINEQNAGHQKQGIVSNMLGY